ncbi:MAG: potassium transporter Kup [Alphaproteobacteria bacterium]
MPATKTAPSLATLVLGAIGVVYGDIGTSPIYTMREAFAGAHPLALDRAHILGVVSLIFWSITIVVSIKYVAFVMRADNKREGGVLALLALVGRVMHGSRIGLVIPVIGIFAAGLFYGDSMLTPAISVLSAVEGLEVVNPSLEPYVLPLTAGIIVVLFAAQRWGTGLLGSLFGPIISLWFAALAIAGAAKIAEYPAILAALNPAYAIQFFILDKWLAFLALGSVFLAVTGAEALYADMGHFGRKPIRRAWFLAVMPALLLNYFGQGALLIEQPEAIDSSFFRMVPDWALLPLVVLATIATIIASQAVISGAFSVTRQAIQLGYLPRLRIRHTSEAEIGQIYIPFINWSLMVLVILLVVGFESSSNLASAYGVAVSGTMIITSVLIGFVMFRTWRMKRPVAFMLLAFFLTIDLAFFAANATKIPHGGWFPLLVGVIALILLTTWHRGRALLAQQRERAMLPDEMFLKSLSADTPRVQGTSVFMTAQEQGIPNALLHNLKHNKVLHERVIFLTTRVEDVPRVEPEEQILVSSLGRRFYRVIVRFGFMQDPDVPKALARLDAHGLPIDLMDTSFFLGRETVIPSRQRGMSLWREVVFAWMSRNAASAMEFYRLPTNRVVELGSQIKI